MEFEEFYDIIKEEFGNKLSKESRTINYRGKRCLRQLYDKHIKNKNVSQEDIIKFKDFYQVGVFFGRTIIGSGHFWLDERNRKDLSKKISEIKKPNK